MVSAWPMEDAGTLEALWRYPVKALAGEPLREAEIAAGGIPGDRSTALFVLRGHAREGKTYRGKEHDLLHTTREIDRAAGFARERGVTVRVEDGDPQTHYFDDAPVSVIFDRWHAQAEAAVGRTLEPLRWRANLYVRAAPGFEQSETQLLGRALEIGSAVLRVIAPIHRCVTPTYDLQTGASDARLLAYIANERENTMGVYCEVQRAGRVRADDAVRVSG